MQLIWEIFVQTLRTLWAHKLRSFLTMFGIAWGVGSLLLLVGLGEGFRDGQKKQMATMGERIIWIFGGRIPAVDGSLSSMKPFNLTYDDYLAVKQQAKVIQDVSPVISRQDIRESSPFSSANGEVFGVLPEYGKIRSLPLRAGRWLNEEDEKQDRQVAVIGAEMEKNMYPGEDAVGTIVTLNGMRFEIVGVVKKIGREGNNGTNIRTFIPFGIMQKNFPIKESEQTNPISFMNYQPPSLATHQAAVDEMHRILAERYNFDAKAPDAFNEQDTLEQQKTVGKIFDVMNVFLGGVGLVTLALGAIGIINIMLVSVAERTKEIGLRKALGATHRSILTQFFLEGAFLTLLSGGIGIFLAAGFMGLLGLLPQPEGFSTPRLVPMSAAVALISLSFAGIVAGLYPARQAAMMTPVDALRAE